MADLNYLAAALADRYRLDRELGSGGMATVYLAHDRKHGRDVAIKVLRPDLAESLGRERFLREIRLAAGMSHPHILPLYDSGEAEGVLYFVMPLMEGQTLRERLAAGPPLPIEEVVRIATEVADALDYAHRHDIVHRDIKPENILLHEGHAVVADFGIGKAIFAAAVDHATVTQFGVMVGTPAYLSPEQAAGDSLDGRSDLFALGCVLYEMLTGEVAFAAPSTPAVIAKRFVYSPPPVTAIRADVPRVLAATVSRLLQRSPEDRFASGADVVAALRSQSDEWGLEPDPAVAALAARLRVPADPPPHGAVTAAVRSGSTVMGGEEGEPARDDAEPGHGVTDRSPAFPRHLRLPGLALVFAAIFAIGGYLAAGTAVRGVTRTDSADDAGAHLDLSESAPSRPLEQGSIAVLPFIDLSPEQDQEFFSDGITEELITHLSRVKGLKVIARTSSFQFKGTLADVREVGTRLGVVHVLEGSVRKAGSRLRITVQLINVEDGFHVWAETYERRMSDVFAVQEEISRAVADTLRIHLVDGEAGAGVQRHTPSVEAYELFLRGRFFANKRTEDALARAAEYFQQAIAIDPRFARAYVGLADTYIAPRDGAPAERFLRARELVTTALAMDSTLAEAHTAMGWIRMWYDRDWAAAERHLQRAVALDPGYLWGQQWYGAYLSAVGRPDQSLVASRRAQQLDPLSVTANTHLGTSLFFLGRYEEAILQYRKALGLDSHFFMARWGLSRAYLELGRHAEAMRELQYTGTDYLGFFRPALLGYAHAVAGQEAEARQVLAELRERREQGEYIAPTEFAAIHLGLGERNEALDWLEHHEADRGARIFLQVDPIFAPLRTEVRFQRLLRRLRFE